MARAAEQRRRPESKSVSMSVFVMSILLVAVVAFVGGTRSDALRTYIAQLSGKTASTSGEVDYSVAQDVYRQLVENYDGKLDGEKLSYGAARGLVDAAGDTYTEFMDADQAAEFEKNMSGDVGAGIGAEVGIRSGQPTIIRPIPGNPAARAGLQAGDTIVGINDVSTRNWTLEKTVSKLRGEAGSTVKVLVERNLDRKEVTITRERIDNPSVQSSMNGEVGVIRMSRFDQETGTLARNAAQDLVDKGAKGIVLDLRDNGGGYVAAAQQVLGLWLKDQTILTERKGDKVVETLKSTGEPILASTKTTVLINGGSASASEIVAGALQEYGKATLVGEKSFGKGSVQKVIDLGDGSILKVTIARWYTPKGKNITKEGITPQQTVELTADDVDQGKDPQLDAALTTINQ